MMRKLLGAMSLAFLLWFCTPQYCFAEPCIITPDNPKTVYSELFTMDNEEQWTITVTMAADRIAWMYDGEELDPNEIILYALKVCERNPNCVEAIESREEHTVRLLGGATYPGMVILIKFAPGCAL